MCQATLEQKPRHKVTRLTVAAPTMLLMMHPLYEPKSSMGSQGKELFCAGVVHARHVCTKSDR